MDLSTYVDAYKKQHLDPLPVGVYLLDATQETVQVSFRNDGSNPVTINASDVVSIDDHGAVDAIDTYGPTGFQRPEAICNARRVVLFLNPSTIDPLLREVLSRNQLIMQAVQSRELERAETGCSCGGSRSTAAKPCGCSQSADVQDDVRILGSCARSCKACRPYDYCRSSDWCCVTTLGYACKSCPF